MCVVLFEASRQKKNCFQTFVNCVFGRTPQWFGEWIDRVSIRLGLSRLGVRVPAPQQRPVAFKQDTQRDRAPTTFSTFPYPANLFKLHRARAQNSADGLRIATFKFRLQQNSQQHESSFPLHPISVGKDHAMKLPEIETEWHFGLRGSGPPSCEGER
jgi:hypothetical protein